VTNIENVDPRFEKAVTLGEQRKQQEASKENYEEG
jgi:hypothetical protein